MIEDHIKNITDWLEKTREAYTNIALSAGIPLSYQVSIPVVDVKDEGRWTGRFELRKKSPFYFPKEARRLNELIDKKGNIPDAPSSQLFDEYGDKCKTWSPFVKPSFEESPTDWIRDRLLYQLVDEYLTSIPALDESDPNIAEKLTREILSHIESETVDSVISIPIAGISFEDSPVFLERVTFRRLTRDELGELLISTLNLPLEPRGNFQPAYEHGVERWVLEVSTPCPKEQAPNPDNLIDRLVLALQLLGFELHGRGNATVKTSHAVSLGVGSRVFRLPKTGSAKECSKDCLKRAIELAEKIPDNAISRPENRKEIALHRFSLGAGEDTPADALIDYVITLEALLLPRKYEGELSFRLRLHGANFLGSNPMERKDLFRQIKRIYNLRSDLVHGSKMHPQGEIKETAASARLLVGNALVKALEEGWPTQEQLEERSLGVK